MDWSMVEQITVCRRVDPVVFPINCLLWADVAARRVSSSLARCHIAQSSRPLDDCVCNVIAFIDWLNASIPARLLARCTSVVSVGVSVYDDCVTAASLDWYTRMLLVSAAFSQFYHVSQKNCTIFIFFNNYVKASSILIIFGRHIPQ